MAARRLILLVALTVAPVAADAADWVETEGARLRMVVGRAAGDGQVRAMLDIDLKPGWKTYWREPGESGIPPTIDVQPAGTAEASFEFPAPVYVSDAYGGFTGYVEPVRLPVVLPTSAKSADVFLGVCRQVCVPVSASFPLETEIEASALHAAMVDQAFDDLPSEPTDHLRITKASLGEDGQFLRVEATATADGQVHLFLAPRSQSGHVFGVATPVDANDGQAVFAVPILRTPETRDEQKLPPFSATLVQGASSVHQNITID